MKFERPTEMSGVFESQLERNGFYRVSFQQQFLRVPQAQFIEPGMRTLIKTPIKVSLHLPPRNGTEPGDVLSSILGRTTQRRPIMEPIQMTAHANTNSFSRYVANHPRTCPANPTFSENLSYTSCRFTYGYCRENKRPTRDF